MVQSPIRKTDTNVVISSREALIEKFISRLLLEWLEKQKKNSKD